MAVSGIEHSYGFLFAKAHQKLMEILEPVFNREDITPKQLGLLLIVHTHAGITQKDAAQRQRIDRTTMTKVVDSLEERGLLERRTDPNDRRAYGLYLTPTGKKKVRALQQALAAAHEVLFSGLRREDVTRLREMLLTIVQTEGNHER